MKLSLAITNLTADDAPKFNANLTQQSYRIITEDIYLIFHTSTSSELLADLIAGLQNPATLVLALVSEDLFGKGQDGLAEFSVRNIFSKK